MFASTKQIIISGLLAGVLTVLIKFGIDTSGIAASVCLVLAFPFVLLGFLFSGNVHQPSELVTFASMFLFWTCMFYLAQNRWVRFR